jgi:hypothetical protein
VWLESGHIARMDLTAEDGLQRGLFPLEQPGRTPGNHHLACDSRALDHLSPLARLQSRDAASGPDGTAHRVDGARIDDRPASARGTTTPPSTAPRSACLSRIYPFTQSETVPTFRNARSVTVPDLLESAEKPLCHVCAGPTPSKGRLSANCSHRKAKRLRFLDLLSHKNRIRQSPTTY